MNKISILTAVILLSCVNIFTQGQLKEKYRKSKTLDSLSYIQIDKIIYYQTPVEMYNGKLTSQFEPAWYNAYCVNENADRFKENPKEVLRFTHKSIRISDSALVTAMQHPRPKPSYYLPYSYFFGEVQLTHKSTGQKIILVFEKDNETKLSEFTMKLPTEKNSSTEKLDSIRMRAVGLNYYLIENGIVKFPDPIFVDSLLTNNSEYFIKPNLDDFKNMLYRSKSYRISTHENGARKFSTMEKGIKGFVKKEESDKP